MEKKFHYNPTTGHVSLCKAEIQCPWGEEVHYATQAEARKGFEDAATQAQAGLPKLRRPKEGPLLSTVMDTSKLAQLREEGYVMVARHPQDPALQVLTYSKLAQLQRKWNDVTTQTRGLIVHSQRDDFSDAVVVERPWRKFFTLAQHESGWSLGDEEEGAASAANSELANLDFTAPAEVTDKCDGSLGILYRAPDGKLALSTKGSFASTQAGYYTKMLRNNEALYGAAEELKNNHPGTSFLFELTGPDNQVVLEYDKDDIILLGAVEKESGRYNSTRAYAKEWSSKGHTVAEALPAANLTEALAIPDRPGREGLVVRIAAEDPKKQMMLKVKQEDYLRLHRLASGFTKSAARAYLRDSQATMADLLEAGRQGDFNRVPELGESLRVVREGKSPFHAKVYEGHASHLNATVTPKLKELAEAHDQVKALPESAFRGATASKNFAVSIAQETPFKKAQLFSFFNARLQGKTLEEMSSSSVLRSLSKSV